MSVYEINYKVTPTNPWAIFNEAIKKRDANGGTFDPQGELQAPWGPYIEDEDAQDMLEQQEVIEQQEFPTQGEQRCQDTYNQYTGQDNASEAEECENDLSDCASSRYDDSQIGDYECDEPEYDGPDDYVTDLFEVTNYNPFVEDAIVHYNANSVNRRTLDYKRELADIIKEQKEVYFLEQSGEEIPAEIKERQLTIKLPPYNPLFDAIRESRAERKLQFSNTRVIRFDKTDTVAKDDTQIPKNKLPGRSILKHKKDLFVTPNHDSELVGESKLAVAIGRLYNLCDMPLELLDKNELVHSAENLATGFANAIKYKELCWKRMSKEAVRVRDEALEQQEDEIEALKTENDTLNVEVAELKEKLREKELNLEKEARESRSNLNLAEEKKRDLKQTIAEMQVINLDLLEARSAMDALQADNDDLRKNLKDCQKNLLEQKRYSKPLLVKIKELETKVVKEQRCATDSQQKIASLERYRTESFLLQKKVEAFEESNRRLVNENRKLQGENDDLLCKSELLKTSLTFTVEDLKASKQREAELLMTNRDLGKRVDEANVNVMRLVDTNTAYKAKFHQKYQEFEKRYAQVWKDCNDRRNEIEKTKLEMEKMGKTLKDTRKKMARNRENNTVSICSENMVVHEPPNDVLMAQDYHVKGRHRLFQSLTNRLYSSPVINVGEV